MIWPFTRRLSTPDIDPSLWRQSAAGLPWLRGIDPERDSRLRALSAQFVQRIAITPLHGLRLNDVPVSDGAQLLTEADARDGVIKLAAGKKKIVLVKPL